jgi:hypothetical protein
MEYTWPRGTRRKEGNQKKKRYDELQVSCKLVCFSVPSLISDSRRLSITTNKIFFLWRLCVFMSSCPLHAPAAS